MTKFSLILAAFAAVVVSSLLGYASAAEEATALEPLTDAAYSSLFSEFKEKFPRTYANASEEATRLKNFKVNIDFIREHNNDKSQTFTVGMNQFGDLTLEEWNKSYKGFNIPKDYKLTRPPPADFEKVDIADSVDWRTAGVVGPIHNQGSCGSCWAWSTLATVESAWAIARGELHELAPQQLVDCNRRNQGCSGGFMVTAMEYIIANNGVCSAASYPYTGRQSRCQKCDPVVGISSYVDLKGLGETGLLKGLNLGPVAVAVQSNSRGFMFYKKGIINGSCGRSLDHAIAAVGYSADPEILDKDGKPTPYYTIKNSWGTSWGEDGYVRIIRGKNMCGVADMASFPVVKGLGLST